MTASAQPCRADPAQARAVIDRARRDPVWLEATFDRCRTDLPWAQQVVALAGAEPEWAAILLEKSQRDPAWWIETFLGLKLTPMQHEMCAAIAKHSRICVKTANGVGKTYCAAALVLYLGSCFADSVIITTATKFKQAEKSMWREINLLAARKRLPLGAVILQTEARWPNGSVAFAMTAPENETEKFLGIRGKRTTIVVDEAPGVSEAIFTGVVSILTGAHSKLLLLGNPTDPNCFFARAFRTSAPEEGGYCKITLTAFDSPNVQPFGITEADIISGEWKKKSPPVDQLPVPGVTDAAWIRARWEDWTDFGARPNDPRWLGRAWAEFPEEGEDTLIPLAWIDAAWALGYRAPDGSWAYQARAEAEAWATTPRENGVDVAGDGKDSDESVIAARRGIFARILRVIARADTEKVADYAVEEHRKVEAETTKVDAIGVGAGVYDKVKKRVKAKPVKTGNPARNPERYANLRAEGADNLRTRFRDSYRAFHGEKDPDTDLPVMPGIILEGEKDEKLGADLSSMKWDPPDERGRSRLEPKRKTKSRISRSPDRGDALTLAFIQPKAEVVMV